MQPDKVRDLNREWEQFELLLSGEAKKKERNRLNRKSEEVLLQHLI